MTIAAIRFDVLRIFSVIEFFCLKIVNISATIYVRRLAQCTTLWRSAEV